MAMKSFIQWLHGRPGFKSCITYDDAEYFNPSANDERVAKAVRPTPIPTVDQIQIVVDAMPEETLVQRRDRAVMAFAILSGARDNAIASFAIGHVNLVKRTVFQDARTVRTKNAKTFTSGFFPVDARFEEVVADWIAELTALGFGAAEPLFPTTAVTQGADRSFVVSGLTHEFWQNANAIRRIFKEAFELAGLPYFNPHSFRKTLAIHGEKICRTAEEWRAYSQNFGHSSPMTTFASYGEVTHYRQLEIMDSLGDRSADEGRGPISENRVRAILENLGQELRAR
jgi:integrase